MSKIDTLKRYYYYYGMKMLLLKLFRNHSAENFDYDLWLKKNTITEAELEKQKKYEFTYNPKISIIVPTYETPEIFLREMIESVQRQTYSNWELCIADGSVSDQVMQVIQAYAQADKRIIVKKLTKNKGIADNTNAAIAIASGEYIALLDHDDLLAPDALFEVVRCVNDNEKADVIYSDEDKITADSARRFEPHFKTDFNIELLRSNNYICHLFVVKRLIVEEIGGFRNDFDGAQDYDLILRCIEKAEGIYHIPKILYHWRVHQSSTAENPESKLYAYDAGKRAIEEHLKRVDRPGKVRELYYRGFYHVTYKVKEKTGVTVCFVGNNKTDVKKCMKSIKKTAGKVKCQFIAVKSIKEVKEEQIRYEYVLFVDSSIRMISKNWMREMIGICQFPENGVVGIQLINKKNQTIYHNGFLKGQKGYAFQGQPVEAVGYFHRDELTQCVDGVTDKFMMMKTEQLSTELLRKSGKDIIVEKAIGNFVVDPQIKAYFNIKKVWR